MSAPPSSAGGSHSTSIEKSEVSTTLGIGGPGGTEKIIVI